MQSYIVQLAGIVVFALCAITPAPAQWLKSTNIPAPYDNNHWLDVYFLRSNPDFGWVCGFQGFVIRTTDGGATWQGSQIPNAFHLESVNFPTERIGYCTGPAGVFKSTDGGETWRDIRPASAEQNGGGFPPTWRIWGCYFFDADNGYMVGGGCGNSPQQFFRTTNGGTTWSKFTLNNGQSGLTDVVVYDLNGLGYAAGSGYVYQTFDGGRSWQSLTTTGSRVWHEEVTNVNQSFLVPVAGTDCSGGGLNVGGMRFSTDGGSTWESEVVPDRMYGAYLADERTGWACGLTGLVYYTDDAGVTWDLRNCGIDDNDSLDDMYFIDEDRGWVVGNGVYRSNFFVLDPPVVSANGPLTFCEGGNVELTASEGYALYRWSNGEFGRSITVEESGDYTVRVADITGCHRAEATVSVEIVPRPLPVISAEGNATVLCEGETIRLSVAEGYANYEWSNGATEPSILVSEAGEFSVTVTDENGCTGVSAPFNVRIVPNPEPEIELSGLPFFCRGETVELSVKSEYDSYLWSTGETTRRIAVGEAGLYSVTVTDVNGCTGTAAAVEVRLRADADQLRIISNLADGVYIFPDRHTGVLFCGEIELENTSPTDLVEIPVASLLRNIEFSLPRSQFPLVLQPGQRKSLRVCFTPRQLGEFRDTLILPEQCLPPLALLGQGVPQIFSAHSDCDVDLSARTAETPDGILASFQPFPNPAAREFTAPMQKTFEIGQAGVTERCCLYDRFGSLVAEGRYRRTERSSNGDTVYEWGEFVVNVEGLSQGLYYLSIQSEGAVLSYAVAIAR